MPHRASTRLHLRRVSTRLYASISAILAPVLLVALTQAGCTGLTSVGRTGSNPANATPSGKLTASPASLSFGNVATGSSTHQSLVLTNSGAQAVTISQVSASGGGFAVSGPSLPLTLGVGQSATFAANFTPSATGNATGDISVASNQLSSTATIPLTGVGVPVAPSITAQPASQAVIVGQAATFSVIASGTAPLSYQWSKNGAAITGATSANYTTPATTASDNGSQITVTVGNSAGNVTSSTALLTVNASVVGPSITLQPISQAVSVGQAATFSVAASGTAPLSYQWQKNGASIGGATSSGYTTSPAVSGDSGATFRAIVTNAAGSITSNSATLTVTPPPAAGTDVTTYHNDSARTGQNLTETKLTPANVNSQTFGLLRNLSVDGKVDAEPLYLSRLPIAGGNYNVVFIATEHDSVYAFDSDTGAQLWKVSVLASGETTSDDRGCAQVSPEIGVTSTPVIDRSAGPHGIIYVVAMSKKGSTYFQRLHALDVTTGAELLGGPIAIQASYPGTGANSSGGQVIFDPQQYKERAGLLLLNGVVYTSWASHCDINPYTAWIIGYNASNLSQTSVLNLTPNGSEGSIWQSGGGPAADPQGNIYVLVANGTFETTLTTAGFPSSGDYGNAFVKVSTAGGILQVADYFNMSNTGSESNADLDLGSGAPMVLPDLGAGNTLHLAVGAGKDGNIYVVDRANMGKFNPTSDNVYQELPGAVPNGVYGVPAYFNGTVYYCDVGATLKAFPISNGKLSGTPAQTATSFNYPGVLPSVSANGGSNGIVWGIENTGTAVLHAYAASDLTQELYNSNQAPNGRDQFGSGNKFITPMIADGKVFAATTNSVAVFGALP